MRSIFMGDSPFTSSFGNQPGAAKVVVRAAGMAGQPVSLAFQPFGMGQVKAVKATREGAVERPAPQGRQVERLCSILRRFTEEAVPDDVKARVFWSYVDDAGRPEADVLAEIRSACPDLSVPARPAMAPELKPDRPDQVGFRGKARISLEEAKELLAALDEVLRPLTPEETASDIAREECLRELAAGAFPIVERLRERLADFVATAGPQDTFEISHGQLVVTGKAVDCAVAIGRGRVVRTALTVGGVGAGAGLLALLLL
jgi:hypothetical protein